MTDLLKPPIFLLGNVRSGTSMMHDLFDLHPQVKSWYEPRTIWVYPAPRRKHDRFDATDATPKVCRYIRHQFLKYQQAHGDLRIMEKTPSNIMRIPYVRAIFPESKYLYMVRHPLDQLSSSEIKWRQPITLAHVRMRLSQTPWHQLPAYAGRFVRDHFRSKILRRQHVSVWGVRYPGIYQDIAQLTTEQVIAKQWAACSQQAEKDLAQCPPHLLLRLRYEDFVADPAHHFTRIGQHFDLPITDQLKQQVTAIVDPHRQNKWRRIPPDVLRPCLSILEPEMKQHDYHIPQDLLDAATTSSDR